MAHAPYPSHFITNQPSRVERGGLLLVPYHVVTALPPIWQFTGSVICTTRAAHKRSWFVNEIYDSPNHIVPIYSSTVTTTVKLSHLHPPTSQSIETTKSWIFGDDAITTGVARSPLAHLLMQNHPQPQQYWWQSKCWPVSGGCAYLPTYLENATLQQQQRNNKRALRFAIRIGHSWNSIVVARAFYHHHRHKRTSQQTNPTPTNLTVGQGGYSGSLGYCEWRARLRRRSLRTTILEVYTIHGGDGVSCTFR